MQASSCQPFDDKLLREWFERNRAKYDEPARYDFQEAVLSGNPSEAPFAISSRP